MVQQNSLLNGMYLGEMEDYNVPLYRDQVYKLWQETKEDFTRLFNWNKSNPPDSDSFYERTRASFELMNAIQASYRFDDTCYTIPVGDEPLGMVAANILQLRQQYGYFFDMIWIEEERWLREEFGALSREIEKLDFWFENQVPGITRVMGKMPAMMRSTTYDELLTELKLAYLDPTTSGWPMVLAFSGGKDSTLVAKAMFQMLEALTEYKRVRPVYIVSSNTGLELPALNEHLIENAHDMREYAKVKNLPIEVHLLQPDVSQRFFALLIGAGYLPPSRSFLRWCTKRLKISVNMSLIKDLAIKYGGVVTVLGVREDESVSRKKSIQKHSQGDDRYDSRLSKVKVEGKIREIRQLVYQPIRYFGTGSVWEALEKDGLPWGLGYSRLKKLYKDAAGGECPLIMTSDTPRACGSGRYGCWTCTLIKEDRTLLNTIEKGNEWLRPLSEFRQFIIDLAKDPSMREVAMYDRKTGKILKDRSQGGFNRKARRLLFSELMKLRETIARTKPPDVVFDVISDEEIAQIQKYWRELDQITLWSDAHQGQLALMN